MANYTDQGDSSADDEPLAEILKKPHNDEQQQQQQIENTQNSTLNSKKNSRKYNSGLDDSSDDEPLKMTKAKLKSNENKSGSSNGIRRTSKKGDQDDSSDDDVPLAKIPKKPQNDEQLQPSEKTQNSTLNPKKTSRKDGSGSEDSSDDEPLIKTAKTSPPPKKPKSNENKSGGSNGIHRTSEKADQDDSSDDDVPLAKTLKKPQNDKRQRQSEKRLNSTLNSKMNSRKDSSGLDCTSDDEPLIKVAKTLPAKKLGINDRKQGSRNGTRKNRKKAVSDHDYSSDEDVPLTKFLKKPHDDEQQCGKSLTLKTASRKDDDLEKKDNRSDDEPLIKTSKRSSKTAKENTSSPSADRKDSLDDNGSSDDEPLIDIAKRLKAQPRARAPLPPPRKETLKCRRKVSKKPLKYEESSSDGSDDDEPLSKLKRRKSLSKEKVSTNCIKRKEKAEDQMPQEMSSEDEPVINMVSRAVKNKIAPLSSDNSCDEKQPKPGRKTSAPTRRTPVKRTTKAARKIQGLSDESTDDEPLMNLVKRPLRAATKTTAPAKRKTGRTSVSRKKPGSGHTCEGSSGDSSDDKPLIKMARNPHVNKILSIILERCDVEEVGGAKA